MSRLSPLRRRGRLHPGVGAGAEALSIRSAVPGALVAPVLELVAARGRRAPAAAFAFGGKAFLARAKYQTACTSVFLNCCSERSALPRRLSACCCASAGFVAYVSIVEAGGCLGDSGVRVAVLVVAGVELLPQDAAVPGDLLGGLGRLGPGEHAARGNAAVDEADVVPSGPSNGIGSLTMPRCAQYSVSTRSIVPEPSGPEFSEPNVEPSPS
ncbi:hypothetical protein GCM10020218_065000 [Dactylosporangium vinaceum]